MFPFDERKHIQVKGHNDRAQDVMMEPQFSTVELESGQ
jgi:hypothetical protein